MNNDRLRIILATVVEQLDGATDHDDLSIRTGRVVEQIRALLAEAQPVSPPEPVELTDEQIESAFREWWKDGFGFPYFGAVPLVACVEWTKAAMARWGRPAPVPVKDQDSAVAFAESVIASLRSAPINPPKPMDEEEDPCDDSDLDLDFDDEDPSLTAAERNPSLR
jgi:hypothetical protein